MAVVKLDEKSYDDCICTEILRYQLAVLAYLLSRLRYRHKYDLYDFTVYLLLGALDWSVKKSHLTFFVR